MDKTRKVKKRQKRKKDKTNGERERVKSRKTAETNSWINKRR